MAEEARTIVLRVKPHIQLPYEALLSVGPGKPKAIHRFTPDCAVEESVARVLLKTQANVYEEAKGKPDMEKYTFKPSFEAAQFAELVGGLTDKGKVAVYHFAKLVAEAEAAGEEIPTIDVKQQGHKKGLPKTRKELEEMTLEELEELYERLPIEQQPEIPNGAKKAVVVELMAEALNID